MGHEKSSSPAPVWQRLRKFHSAKKLVLNDDEQKDINRSLSFMRNNERFSDLRFICNDKVMVNAHSELFRQASPFLADIFEIAKEKQPYETVFLSLADTESKVITKLVQAM